MESCCCVIETEASMNLDGPDEFCDICGFRVTAGMLSDCEHCGLRLCDYCASAHMSTKTRAAHAH